MIFSDEANLYIKNGLIPIMIKAIGFEEVGLYLTIRSFEFDNPNGVEEIKIFESSSDGIAKTKEVLEGLIEKGYAERTEERIKTTNKQFE
jgi:hypothetical protein